jgi:CRISPR/Cas system-associated exonuclease Cas4 (RecB family)
VTPEQFAQEFGPEFAPHISPYGNTAQPVKPGLTKRGKTALAVGAAVLAGGGILAWQDYSADVAASQVKAQELVLKQQELRIQELKEINKAAAAQKKDQAAEDSARQKFVDACITADKSLVGKQMGVTYSSVVADCQAQFRSQTDNASGADMAIAGSANDTGSSQGGGINTSGLVGIAVGGGLLVALGANRMKKSHAK